MPTIKDIADEALIIAYHKGESAALKYIDGQTELPNCNIERQKMAWKRQRVKENFQAALRQTKTTGPQNTK